jgi:hypothetical protein
VNRNNQDPCELAEVVYEKPLSGVFEEVLFGSDRGNTLWVKFSDKDGAGEWIGKFGVGGGGAGHLIKFAEPDQFIVWAGSFAYLIDATHRKLVSQYYNDNALEIIYDKKRKTFIVADYTSLNWVEFGGKIRFSRNISVDGIRDLKIENNILSGLGFPNYDGEEKRFTFDLEALEVLGWERVVSKNYGNKKSWWKFW